MSHLAHTTRLVLENISAYKAPKSCVRLPALTVGTRHLYGANLESAEKDKKGWVYVDVTPPNRECDFYFY